jgi:hypothetical protein
MPDLVPAVLIGLALMALVGFLYWADRRYPAPSKSRERPFLLTYCAWCVHGDGDLCTNPRSPVYGQECGLVCIGVELWLQDARGEAVAVIGRHPRRL